MAIPGDKNSAWCSVVPRNFEYSTCVFCCKNLEQMHFIWVSMYLTLKQYLRTLFLRLLLKTVKRHFTWSSEPREGPAVFKAKAVTSFLGDFSPAGDCCCCCCCCCVDVLLFGFVFFFCRKHNYDTELPAARLTLVLKELFFWGGSTQKKIRRVCMGFSKNNWATISETICSEMLIIGK